MLHPQRHRHALGASIDIHGHGQLGASHLFEEKCRTAVRLLGHTICDGSHLEQRIHLDRDAPQLICGFEFLQEGLVIAVHGASLNQAGIREKP